MPGSKPTGQVGEGQESVKPEGSAEPGVSDAGDADAGECPADVEARIEAAEEESDLEQLLDILAASLGDTGVSEVALDALYRLAQDPDVVVEAPAGKAVETISACLQSFVEDATLLEMVLGVMCCLVVV